MSERLYSSLPTFYRQRDQTQGEPLRALLATLEAELAALEEDVDRLYDDAFIETCQSWVIPYLGDLVGVRVLGRRPHAVAHPRAQVAAAADLRRHKGTPMAIERASRDVTGWFARLVELFEHLAHTQHVQFLRPGKGGLFDLAVGFPPVSAMDDPFGPPRTFHSIEVGRSGVGRSPFNLPSLALHLWRLRAYALTDSPATVGRMGNDPVAGGFHVDPLGRDLQLFHRPDLEGALIRQSAARHLPIALSLDTLDADLQRYRRRWASEIPAVRAPNSDFYGPGRSLHVAPAGNGVAPVDVVARSLDAWGAPGVMSGDLPVFPALRQPQLVVRLAGVEHTVSLAELPTDLRQAAAILEAAIQAAPAAIGVRVVTVDRRLLVLPAVATDTVEVLPASAASPGADATTAAELALTAGAGAEAVSGLLSADLSAFPALPLPEVSVTLGAEPPRTISLGDLPGDLAETRRRLEAGLRAASTAVADSFADARVAVLDGDRLLVLPGNPDDAVSVAATGSDATTADELGLTGSTVGGQAVQTAGLLSAELAPFPGLGPDLVLRIRVTMADITTTITTETNLPRPRSLEEARAILETAIQIAQEEREFRDARVLRVGRRLLVLPGVAGKTVTIEDAVDGTAVTASDTASRLGFASAAVTTEALLSGRLAPLPILSAAPRVIVTIGAAGPVTTILSSVPHSLEAARLGLETALRRASGVAVFRNARVLVVGDRLLVLPGKVGRLVTVADTGASAIATTLRLTAGAGAVTTEGLLSAALSPVPSLSVAPALQVTIAEEGPHGIALDRIPTDLEGLRRELERSLRRAHSSPGFRDARLALRANRLLAVSGIPGDQVAFAATEEDSATVAAIGLDAATVTPAMGTLSGILVPFPSLRRPTVAATIGGGLPSSVTLRDLPANLSQAAALLQEALRQAHATPAFQEARVLALSSSLLVLPGAPDDQVTFTASAEDATTAGELALDTGTALRGLQSGTPPAVSALPETPVVSVTIGPVTSANVTLVAPPHAAGEPAFSSLQEVALSLESAIRGAPGGDAGFTGARVLVAGDGLLVLPGLPFAAVTIEGVAADPSSAQRLGLDPSAALATEALESGDLSIFPAPLAFAPKIRLDIGGEGGEAVLAQIPRDLAAARRGLESAVRAAITDNPVADARFTAAQVLAVGGRLVVLAGEPGLPVAVAPVSGNPAADASTALLLDLAWRLAMDPLRGRLLFALGAEPAVGESVRVGHAYGFAADLGGGPYDRRATLADENAAGFFGEVNRSDATAFPTLQGAVDAWNTEGRPDGVIRVTDNEIYPEPLEIPLPAGSRLTLEAADGRRPVVLGTANPALVGEPAGVGGELTVNGLLVDAGFELRDNLGLKLLHTTLVPKPGRPSLSHTPSAGSDASDLAVSISSSIVGTLPLPSELASLALEDSILDAQGAGEAATTQSALISGTLPASLQLSSALEMKATIGTAVGPVVVRLADLPRDLDDARRLLEEAIQVANPAPSFAGATVAVVGDRLLVRSGDAAESVVFAATTTDSNTVRELNLLPPAAQPAQGLFSGDLSRFLPFVLPRLLTTFGAASSAVAELAALPATPAEAADLLQAALAAADPSPAFADAAVSLLATTDLGIMDSQSRLLIQPGNAGEQVGFAGTTADAETVVDLRLVELAPQQPAQAIHGLLGNPLDLAGLAGPEIEVTIGSTPATVGLAALPADLATTATFLESGLAGPFPGTNVLHLGDRLLIRPATLNQQVTVSSASGGETSPAAVLRFTAPPAESLVGGLLSAPLEPFIGLTTPQLQIVLDGGTEETAVSLSQIPSDLASAAALLQEALRQASGSAAALASADVLAVGRRLLLQASGAEVTAQAGIDDPDTAAELGLLEPEAVDLFGLLSAPLAGVPDFPRPGVAVTLGLEGPHLASLDSLPANPQEARAALERAIHAAGPNGAFTDAQVSLIGGNQLLVLAGEPDVLITIAPADEDATTAGELGLTAPPARLMTGLLSGRVFPFPALGRLQVEAIIGGGPPLTISLGGPVASLEQVRASLEAGFEDASPGLAHVQVAGARLLIHAAATGSSVVLKATPTDPDSLGLLALTMPPATDVQILRSGDLGSFPSFPVPALRLTLGSQAPVEAILADLPTDLDAAILSLELAVQFTGATVSRLGERLFVAAGGGGDVVLVDGLPASDPGTADDLILTPASGAEAGLLSEDLTFFPDLQDPQVQVSFGAEVGIAELTGLPASVSEAREQLESAIQQAGSSATFTAARVVVDGSSLLLLPGIPGDTVTVDATVDDPDTAGELRLRLADGEQVQGFFSGDFATFPVVTDPPTLDVTIGGTTLAGIALTTPIGDLTQAATSLENAIRSAVGGDAGFTGARVLVVDSRLLVLPGIVGAAVSFAAATANPATVAELALSVLSQSEGLLTGDLSAFPSPLTVAPVVRATLGGTTLDAELERVPIDLADAASLLQDALRNVAGAPPSFAAAVVAVRENRLLVQPGTPGDGVQIGDVPGRPATATALALSAGAGAALGLLSGDLAGFAGLRVAPSVEVTLGPETATAIFSAIPGTLVEARDQLLAAINGASSGARFTGAEVSVDGADRLLVLSGEPNDAVKFANPADPSRTQTATLLGLLGSADGGPAALLNGVRSGDLAAFAGLPEPPPAVLDVTIGTEPTRSIDLGALPQDLEDTRVRLEASIRDAPAGPAFAGTRVAVIGDDRLLILPGVAGARVAVAASAANPSLASDLALTAAQAETTQVLVGVALPAELALTAAPALAVTFGADGPHRAALRALPRTQGEIRALLEQTLQRAALSAAFTDATTKRLGSRLLIVPGSGAGELIRLEDPAVGTPAASLLGLTPSQSRRAEGLLSDAVGMPVLGSAMPQLDATFGGSGEVTDPAVTVTVQLSPPPRTLSQARTSLEAALQAGGLGTTFTGLRVLLVDDERLLVVPGEADSVSFAAAVADAETAAAFKLVNGEEAAAPGLLSAAISFPVVATDRSLAVTLGGAAGNPTIPAVTATAALAALPQTVEQARDLLEGALRAADPRTPFTDTRVLVFGTDRLLILPGAAGDRVHVADGELANALGLEATVAVTTSGLRSGALTDFPRLSIAPRVEATIDVGTPPDVVGIAALSGLPADLDEARVLLEAALRSATSPGGGSDPAFATVRVLRMGDRLLVVPGDNGVGVTIEETGTSSDTAAKLGLDAAGSERGDGLLSGDLAEFVGLGGEFLAFDLTIDGQGPFSATLGALPADADAAEAELQAAIRAAHDTTAFTAATVQVIVGDRLLVTPGVAGAPVAMSATGDDPSTVMALGFDAPLRVTHGSLLSGNLMGFVARPRPSLEATLGGTARELQLPFLPTSLAAAATALTAGLHDAAGGDAAFAAAQVDVVDSRMLVQSPGVTGTEIVFGAATINPDSRTFLRLRLARPQAIEADGLLSGRITRLPAFSATPRLLVRIGGEGPFTATLPALPASPAAARDSLERALRAAHNSPAFVRARVALAEDGAEKRLIVLSGDRADVTIRRHPRDARTARELGFGRRRAKRVGALVSGSLASQLTFPPVPPAPQAEAAVTLEGAAAEAAVVTLIDLTGTLTLAEIATILQGTAGDAVLGISPSGLRGTDPAVPALAGALAAVMDDDRLVLAPGLNGFSIGIEGGDLAAQLALGQAQAVGTARTADEAGPPISLERVTVLGRLSVRELVRASEVLFTEPVLVRRRHVGCLRYSYLPAGSETPRRFRCQPDLALERALSEVAVSCRDLKAAALVLGLKRIDQLPEEEIRRLLDREISRERTRVLAGLVPAFTSRTWSDAGYGQLSQATALEISAGAESGSEMGAFHLLDEALRRSHLRILIAELLRFGLEAGVFRVN